MDFLAGFVFGEGIKDTDSIPCILGKITSGFTPIGDAGDSIINAFYGDWRSAGISFLGILIDAADGVKTAENIGKFLAKNADNSALFAEILSFINKNFPDAFKYYLGS